MKDVERQEAHYGKGGLNDRLRLQILLQHQHLRTTSIYRLLGDPGIYHGVRRATDLRERASLIIVALKSVLMSEEDTSFGDL